MSATSEAGGVPAAGEGHNAPPLADQLRSAREDIREIDEQRTALNADKQSIRKRIKAAGVNLKAFDSACRRAALNEVPEEASKYDASYNECLDAFGVQGNLQLDGEAPAGTTQH